VLDVSLLFLGCIKTDQRKPKPKKMETKELNNISLVLTDNLNCFEQIDSNNAYKYAFIGFSFSSIIITTLICYTIIWYERYGSDKKRTLINKLVSSICWNTLLWCCTVQSLYTVRFAFGPLPPFLCFFLFILKKTIVINYALLLNAITFIRYIFIFWLNNPAAFNDDFWCVFINIWTFGFSFIFQFLRAVVPGNQLLEHHICTGEDPTPILLLPSFGRGYIETFGLVLHVCIYIRIALYKKKQANTFGPVGRSKFLKNLILSDVDKRSISSFATNVCCILVIASGMVLATIGKFDSCSDFKSFPKYLYVYYTYLFIPGFFSIFIFLVFNFRNKDLKQIISRQFSKCNAVLTDCIF